MSPGKRLHSSDHVIPLDPSQMKHATRRSPFTRILAPLPDFPPEN
jgi:hypothetical protein